MLAASGAAAFLGLAGCTEEDADDGGSTEQNAIDDDGSNRDETDEQGMAEQEEATTGSVTLLVEHLGGDHEHEGDHPVSPAVLVEACGHVEFDEPQGLTAGTDHDDAPTIAATHQPFTVSFEGPSGFVTFEMGRAERTDHDHEAEHDHENENADGMLAFLIQDGTATAHDGQTHHEETGVSDCGEVGTYIVVEPEKDHVVVELSPA